MNEFRAVLFDMDGVLVDAREWHYEALNYALSIFGYEISRVDHINKFNGLSTKKKLELLSESKNFPTDLHAIIHNVKQNQTLRIASARCFPIVSIKILLNRLKIVGIKTGVVTNSVSETTKYMLSYSGILELFDVIITNEDVNNPKPSPEGYILAMQKLKVYPSDTLVIEDGEYGILAAKRAQVRKILEVNSPEDVSIELLMSEIKGL
jgi:HAD superfamily hydrolase (TIGR01509 family)